MFIFDALWKASDGSAKHMFGQNKLDIVVAKSTKDVALAEKMAFIRRVMWRDLDERIEELFTQHLMTSDSHIFGGYRLSRKKDYAPINASRLPSYIHLNSTHISTGIRNLGFRIEDEEQPEKLVEAFERNCQIWYSQGPSGQVKVFLAPFTSNAGEIEEKDIIIGVYPEPITISREIIRRHLELFVRYCACTSFHNVSFKTYLYRKYLIYNDFRFRSKYLNTIIITFERILIVSIPLVALWFAIKPSK